MAAENELQIILSLVDDASDKLRKSLGETGKQTEQTTKKSSENWARVSISIMGVYKALKFARDGIVDIINVGKSIDPVFKKSFDNFDTAVLKVKASIAEKLIPMLEVALDFWTKFLNSKTEGSGASSYNEQLRESERNLNILIQREGELKRSIADKFLNAFAYSEENKMRMQADLAMTEKQIELEKARVETIHKLIASNQEKQKSAVDEYLQLKEAKDKIAEMNAEIQKSSDMYLGGKIGASEYYKEITTGEDQVLNIRKESMRQMQELATLTTQVRSQEVLEAQRSTSEQITLLNFYKENYQQAHSGMAAMTVALGQSIKTNLSAGISDVILNVKSAREAFKAFGDAMVKAIVDFMVQKVVSWVLEKTLLAGTVASSVAAGSAVAMAWAPAAAMVSLATLGANAIPASAAIINVNILSAAFAAPKAMAYGGDGVVSRPTLFLAGENGPERATFQPLGASSRASGGGATINIYSPVVTNTDAINELAETISARLARETERI